MKLTVKNISDAFKVLEKGEKNLILQFFIPLLRYHLKAGLNH